jgi:hypothetical protein
MKHNAVSPAVQAETSALDPQFLVRRPMFQRNKSQSLTFDSVTHAAGLLKGGF